MVVSQVKSKSFILIYKVCYILLVVFSIIAVIYDLHESKFCVNIKKKKKGKAKKKKGMRCCSGTHQTRAACKLGYVLTVVIIC